MRQMSRTKARRLWQPWERHIERVAKLAPECNILTPGMRRAWNRRAAWDVSGIVREWSDHAQGTTPPGP